MGKRLIIKGADFSANAVDLSVVNITSRISFATKLNGANLQSDNNRAGFNPRFNLSTYIAKGYTKIQVILKKNGILVFQTPLTTSIAGTEYVKITDVGDGYADAGTYEATIDTTAIYLGANIRTDVAGVGSTLDYYMDIYLIKE